MGRAGGGGGRSSGGHSSSAGRSSGGRSFSSGRSSSSPTTSRHSSPIQSTPSHTSLFSSSSHRVSSPPPPPRPASTPRTSTHYSGGYTPPPPPPRPTHYSGPSAPYGGGYNSPPPPPLPRPPYGQRRRRNGCFPSGCLTSVIIFIAALILLAAISSACSASSSDGIPQSTVQREKLEAGGGFDSNCIVDELGWISNKSQVKKAMKYFWEKTGVQPVIYLKAHDPELRLFEMTKPEQDFVLCGDGRTIGWLDEWFEDMGYSESTYAFVYFDGPESGELYDDHYQFYTVPGRQVGPVMDSEAEDVFYSYLESYWHMDPGQMSEDEMFSNTWRNTADRIMEKPTTRLDVAKYAVVFGIIVFVVYAVFKAVKVRRQHERERNEETAQILNADIHSNSIDSDDTLDRWS